MPEPSLPPGLALAWGVTSTNRRGPKPGVTVTELVAASIELADREGLGALSLPRISERVGLTPSGLYRYVRSKDELLVLMMDVAWGAPPARIARTRTWRTGATAWARGLIDQLTAHPWLLDVPVRGAPMTPNLLRWLESFLRVMSRSGLRTDQCVGCALLLDGYARSTASLSRDLTSTIDPDVRADDVQEFLAARLTSGEFPLVGELLTVNSYTDNERESDVEFGLTRILDGIAKLVDDDRR